MFDLLAAISSVDPPSLVAWAVLVFAAGMYPVGIMLGSSCSPCCGQLECGCAAGVLPQTLTVTVDGFQDGQTQGPPLTALVFSSNFGSGAAGRLTAPGGDPDTDAGPAQSVILTSGGDGYARIARVQPSINASAFSGTGATFSVSLQQIEYEDRPAWEVASVSITNGGTGYPPNGSLSFGFESGGTEAVPAYATFSCGRTQPTVNASVYLSAGSGASLSVSLSQNTGWDGNTVWNVSSVTIENGGSGYSEWESVIFSSPDGEGYGYGIIGSVDENGAITSVSPSYSEFYKSDGVIASVSVDSYSRGVYYKDDASVPGESASITITVNQEGPTAAIAAGAAFTASVDTDTASSTFGQITGVIVASGGDKYLAWKWCEAYLNGLQVVLGKRDTCSWGKQDCGRNFLVEYLGASTPPRVTLTANGCSFVLNAENNISDCSQMTFTASDENERHASVSPGGELSPLGCGDCTGTVTIAGQEVEIGGPWTLFCKNFPIAASPLIWPNRNPRGTFGAAKARAECRIADNNVAAVTVIVDVIAHALFTNLSDVDEQWSGIELGDTRFEDSHFAPFNFTISPAERVLFSRPLKGQHCVDNPFKESGSHFNGETLPIEMCANEIASQSKTPITVNIECGP